ncbi:hypothetical protein [Carboxydothermus pertinax]|uniref:Uncharacterized protein n=1 Tax=Carboxydothermus pertinax TaxID=870242 RepID=A0A1L8CVF8_9THEO|nr:hypothetical protein [Carboxydothermus pertinax]GAV22881.1 hypothetical protein cpu_13910 [Carboxydothermus pertinax]
MGLNGFSYKKNKEKIYVNIFNNAGIALAVVSKDWVIYEANPEFEQSPS